MQGTMLVHIILALIAFAEADVEMNVGNDMDSNNEPTRRKNSDEIEIFPAKTSYIDPQADQPRSVRNRRDVERLTCECIDRTSGVAETNLGGGRPMQVPPSYSGIGGPSTSLYPWYYRDQSNIQRPNNVYQQTRPFYPNGYEATRRLSGPLNGPYNLGQPNAVPYPPSNRGGYGTGRFDPVLKIHRNPMIEGTP